PKLRDSALCAQLKLQASDLVILFIGRLVPEKGVLDLLKTIPLVLERCPNHSIRFLFAGNGPLSNEVQKACQQWPKSVILCPFLPYDQLPALHSLADIFTLPSK